MQHVFDLTHILYIVVSLIITAAALVLIKIFCKTPKSIKITIYVSAALLLASIVANRISLAVIEANALKLMPYSFCSMTSLLISILTLSMKNRNHPVFHCVWYLAIVGPILTLGYPSFIIGLDSNIFGARTFTGMIHHSFALFLAILLLITCEFKPDWRKWWCLALGMCAYLVFGLFQIRALGFEDSMEINRSFVEGTILWWYLVGPIILVVMFVSTLSYELILRKIKRKKNKPDSNTYDKAI